MIWWCEQSSHDLVNTNWQLCITVLKLKSPVLSNICVMQRTLIAVINGVTDFWDKWQISGTNWLTDARLPEDMPAHQALRCHVDIIWLSAISLTKAGSIAQVIPTTDGLTSYAGTTATRHQLTCGEDPPHVVIREWRYGPRWLRIGDDDGHWLSGLMATCLNRYISWNICLLIRVAVYLRSE